MTRTIRPTPHGCRALIACALALTAVPAAEARLGDLDPAFDADGIVVLDVGMGPSQLEAVTTRPDGRPVAAGSAGSDAIVIQRTLEGAADPEFGTSGVVRITTTGLATRLHGVALDAGGRVFATGDRGAVGQAPSPIVLRLNADGGFAVTFGPIGATSGEAHSVLPLAGGGALVAGWHDLATTGVDRPFVARLDANGALDPQFGDGGIAEVPFPTDARALAMAVDAQGRLVLAGWTLVGDVRQPALARFDSGGAIDLSFGVRGMVVLDGAGELHAVQGDGAGRIVVAGMTGTDALVARVLASGDPDGAFGTGGMAQHAAARLSGLVLDGDRALVSGATGTVPDLLLGSLDAAGIPDAGFGGAPPGWRAIPIVFGVAAEALAAAQGPGGKLYAAGLLGQAPLLIRTLPNEAPAASLAAPAQAVAGAPVAFDAGGSSDAEGEALRYAFDLDGDGSFEHDAGVTAVATRSFPAPSTFTVGVRVSDPRGGSAVATRAIAVVAAAPPPPPPKPVLGRQGVARPLRGIVRYRLSGTRRFVRLDGLTAIPNGTEIDARRGRVLLTVVRNASGKLDRARFYAGRFVFRQAKGRKPISTLRLTGGSFSVCRAKGATVASVASARAGNGGKKKVRKLWGDGRGRFRTRGRYGAATVRGTKWLTRDRCDGTLVRVVRGKVSVLDLGAPSPDSRAPAPVGGGEDGGRRTTIVKAGERTLVRAGRGR